MLPAQESLRKIALRWRSFCAIQQAVCRNQLRSRGAAHYGTVKVIRLSYSKEDIKNEERKSWDTGQDCALVRDATRQVLLKYSSTRSEARR
jgi:hypothetical protein